MADPNRADRAMSPAGEMPSAPPPDAFRCKHYGAAVPGAFRLRGEPPQPNVPAVEGHLHAQYLVAWQRLTAKIHSTAQLAGALAEAFESPALDSEDC
jgi:hypothetical protein